MLVSRGILDSSEACDEPLASRRADCGHHPRNLQRLLLVYSLEGLERTTRALLPRNLLCPLEAMARELSLERLVGEKPMELGCDVIYIQWIEERIGSADHFGDARCVRTDHRRAAAHRFERGQAETFVPR